MTVVPMPAVPATAPLPAPLPTALPLDPRTLDARWVARALGLEQQDEVALRDVSVVQIGSDRGHLGSSFRVDLHWAVRPAGAPASVVVKLPATTDGPRSTAARGRLYEREYRFFAELAQSTAVRAPRCFAAGYDAGSDTFALVLEDVSTEVTFDQVMGCPVDRAQVALQELAALHGSWWSRPELYERPWLTTFTHPDRLANLTRLMAEGWPMLCATFRDRLPGDAVRVGAAVLEFLPRGLRSLDAQPQTLLHGDPRLDNLMFDAGEQSAPLVLLDWQNVSRGSGAFDVAYFLAQNLTVPDLVEHGEDLIAGYHAELVEHGVRDLALVDLRRSLRHALPVSFAVAASLAVLTDTSDERIGELTCGMAERALAAADHMGLHDELGLR